jgi:antitoxin component of MazEF toxin-antitoxin module
MSLYLSISVGYLLAMELRIKLRRIGNSLMIAIPSQVVGDLKLKAGDYMLLDIKDSAIVVRKQQTK